MNNKQVIWMDGEYRIVDTRNIPVHHEVTEHRLGGGVCNTFTTIQAIGAPGTGGACVSYLISYPEREPMIPGDVPRTYQVLQFQNGNPVEGINGITNEALLAIVIDRLSMWQETMNRSRENALAITHLQEAMNWLARRTILRSRAGVEGQPNVPMPS